MKKLSISLLAALAMIFAVASAFTTSKPPHANGDFFLDASYTGSRTWVDSQPSSYAFGIDDFDNALPNNPETDCIGTGLVCAANIQSDALVTVYQKGD